MKIKVIFVNIYSFVAFVLTVSGIYTFYPRASIGVSELMNPYKPFYFPFVIRNSGNIPINNFSYNLRTSKLVFNDGVSIINSDFNGLDDTIPRIKIDGSNPIDITHLINSPDNFVKEAEIFIRYNYYTPIIPVHFCDSTKFILNHENNKYTWIEYQY